MSVEARIRELGIELPTMPEPIANYVPAKLAGNLVTTAGQVPVVGDRSIKGKLGESLDVEEGKDATRLCAINCLAALRTVISSLDQVRQIVSAHGLINSAPDFEGQAAAMNGASDFLVEVFGDKGKHARTAVGLLVPMNFAASVYLVAEVDPD